MNRFASALSMHPVPAHAVGEAAGAVLDALGADDPDLLVCFTSPHFAGGLDDMVHALGNLLEPRVLLAVTTGAVVGGAREIERGPAFSIFAARLPDVALTPARLHVEDTPDGASVVGWPEVDGAPDTLLLLADPFTFPVDAFLSRLDHDHPGLAVTGGCASASTRPAGNRLALNAKVVADGAVGVFLEGAELDLVVSQGARPLGRPLVVTEAEGRFVRELAGRPALERLRDLGEDATDDERLLLQQGLQLGVVVDEHQLDFGPGDFLVRTVIGADRGTGAIAVADRIDVGQTVQFHVRDAAAADDDLRALLGGRHAGGALLFTGDDRGHALFGTPDHDAGVLAQTVGPIAIAGGFCAGEIGPVGGRSFLHGCTASVALFPETGPS